MSATSTPGGSGTKTAPAHLPAEELSDVARGDQEAEVKGSPRHRQLRVPDDERRGEVLRGR